MIAVDGACTHLFVVPLLLLDGEEAFPVDGGGKSRGWCRVETIATRESRWFGTHESDTRPNSEFAVNTSLESVRQKPSRNR